jgi:hypothetical protein
MIANRIGKSIGLQYLSIRCEKPVLDFESGWVDIFMVLKIFREEKCPQSTIAEGPL